MVCVCVYVYIYIYIYGIYVKYGVYICMYIYTYTHTHYGVLFSLKKEGNPVIRDKMDKTVGHYAERNKPDMERQYKESLICEIFLKNINIETEHKNGSYHSLQGEKNREKLVKVYKLHIIR